MKRVLHACLYLVLSLSTVGCSSLIVRDADPWYSATGKVATRAVLFWPTMMMSEFVVDTYKHEEYELELAAEAEAEWLNSHAAKQSPAKATLESASARVSMSGT